MPSFTKRPCDSNLCANASACSCQHGHVSCLQSVRLTKLEIQQVLCSMQNLVDHLLCCMQNPFRQSVCCMQNSVDHLLCCMQNPFDHLYRDHDVEGMSDG